MTPSIMSPGLLKAAAHIAYNHANVPWPALWNSLENFCAMVLYRFVLAAGTTHIPETQMYAILQEQLALRKQSEFIDLACDLVFILHGHPSLPVNLETVVYLGKRLQATNLEIVKAECKALLPVAEPPMPKLACPVAWLLTDKGCTKSQESEQVLKAARRLFLVDDNIPYGELLATLEEAYSRAQAQLTFASSRAKVPVEPILQEALLRRGLGMWKLQLKDVMVVLGTAPHVNRRRALRALSKVQQLTVDEVVRQIQVAAQQSDLIDLIDDGHVEWDDVDGESSSS
eukprot:GGOE01004663.1.p1 GENE.GGOE01004663.1~~GGOE01004663.1.p1  ORF type:complete len:286 (-),score=53.34 GGOE01004663.1:1011-1868(-)